MSVPPELLLALDTSASTGRAGIALASDDRLSLAFLEGVPARTEELGPVTATLLASWGKTAADLTAVAAVVGPGSYTGLRSGLAFLRGLAFVGNLPAVAVGALELLAFRGTEPGETCVACVPGGQGRVVCAQYRRGREDVEESDLPVALSLDDLAAHLAATASAGSRLVALDSMCAVLAAPVRSAGLTLQSLSCESLDALSVLVMSRKRRGSTMPVEQLLPVYVGTSNARPNQNRVAVRTAAE